MDTKQKDFFLWFETTFAELAESTGLNKFIREHPIPMGPDGPDPSYPMPPVMEQDLMLQLRDKVWAKINITHGCPGSKYAASKRLKEFMSIAEEYPVYLKNGDRYHRIVPSDVMLDEDDEICINGAMMRSHGNVTEEEYKQAKAAVEKLIPMLHGDTPITDPNARRYLAAAEVMEAYENEHFKI